MENRSQIKTILLKDDPKFKSIKVTGNIAKAHKYFKMKA